MGETLRQNVQRIREAQRLTYVELSRRLGDAGRPIPVLGLRRIERGERRVDGDDLVALAFVLGVSPLTLLLPWTEAADERVQVLGDVEVTAAQLWDWADGRTPLVVSETDPRGDRQRYELDARPPWARAWVRNATMAELVDAVQKYDQQAGAELREVLEGRPRKDEPGE